MISKQNMVDRLFQSWMKSAANETLRQLPTVIIHEKDQSFQAPDIKVDPVKLELTFRNYLLPFLMDERLPLLKMSSTHLSFHDYDSGTAVVKLKIEIGLGITKVITERVSIKVPHQPVSSPSS